MPIMETVERKKPRPRRSFTPEFKAEIVERCRRGDRTIGQVARDYITTWEGWAYLATAIDLASRRAPSRHLRLDRRLVQHAPTAHQPRLPQPR
jgi:hypothetical protein